jgi:hypothetical protein
MDINGVKRKIYEHWSKSITESIPFYKSLHYMSCENLEKGKLHPILKINCKSKGDIHRLPIKLKLLTGKATGYRFIRMN